MGIGGWKLSLFRGKLWRDFLVAWRNFFEIHIHLSARIPDGPADSTSQQIQEKLILPILRPVAHRGRERAALSMLPRPRRRIRRALIALSLHAVGVQGKDHVKIG